MQHKSGTVLSGVTALIVCMPSSCLVCLSLVSFLNGTGCQTGRWQVHNRLRDKCDSHVQDKKHVLFSCSCLEMCYLRRRFEEQFANCTGRTYIGDTGTFSFDDIGAEDLKLFLLSRHTNHSFSF